MTNRNSHMERLFREENHTSNKQIARHNKVTFKEYEIEQEFLLPPSTEEYVNKYHIARLLSAIVNKMDLTYLICRYAGGGTSAYNPRMMLKVWLLGFVKKIYTSRKLEVALKENIAFMWISGRQRPDYKTLSNFRVLLKEDIKTIFKRIVRMGMEVGIIEGKDIFIDHTKYHANASPYKMVWRKTLEKREAKIEAELDKLFEYIDELNEKEDSYYGNAKLGEIKEEAFSKDVIESLVEKINEDMKENNVTKEEAKEIKDKLKRANELLDRKEKIEQQKEIMGDRNSYSTTDNDASAMLMKRSEEIKPAYNEGVAAEKGFILSYDVSQNASDSVSFQTLVKEAEENMEKMPENVGSDAGYGSHENYEFLKEKGINNFVKFPSWYREQKFHGNFTIKDFKYNKEDNSFECLNGVKLEFQRTETKVTANGFKETYSVYSAAKEACANCGIKPWCNKYENKNLHVNWELEKHKEIVRENLKSEKGIEMRKRRSNEVETVFADRKWNQGSRRYWLRGLEKVNIEVGLHNMTHNIKKLYFYILSIQFPEMKEIII